MCGDVKIRSLSFYFFGCDWHTFISCAHGSHATSACCPHRDCIARTFCNALLHSNPAHPPPVHTLRLVCIHLDPCIARMQRPPGVDIAIVCRRNMHSMPCSNPADPPLRTRGATERTSTHTVLIYPATNQVSKGQKTRCWGQRRPTRWGCIRTRTKRWQRLA